MLVSKALRSLWVGAPVQLRRQHAINQQLSHMCCKVERLEVLVERVEWLTWDGLPGPIWVQIPLKYCIEMNNSRWMLPPGNTFP